MKAGLEGGEGDVDDGAVNECHAGTEDGRGEDPGSCLGSTRSYGIAGSNYGLHRKGFHGLRIAVTMSISRFWIAGLGGAASGMVASGWWLRCRC